MRARLLGVLAVAASVAIVAAAACGDRPRADGRRELPAASESSPTDTKPERPFTEIAPNVLGSIAYTDAANSEYTVIVREVAIPARTSSGDLQLDGAAVFQLTQGTGDALVDGRARAMKPGEAFALAQGASVKFDNTGDIPMFFRVHVVQAK